MEEIAVEGFPQLSRRHLGTKGCGRTAAPRWARVAEDVGLVRAPATYAGDVRAKSPSQPLVEAKYFRALLRIRSHVRDYHSYLSRVADRRGTCAGDGRTNSGGGKGGGRATRRCAAGHFWRQHAEAHLSNPRRRTCWRRHSFPVG